MNPAETIRSGESAESAERSPSFQAARSGNEAGDTTKVATPAEAARVKAVQSGTSEPTATSEERTEELRTDCKSVPEPEARTTMRLLTRVSLLAAQPQRSVTILRPKGAKQPKSPNAEKR